MNRTPILAVCFAALLFTGVPLQPALGDAESGLVTWMGRLQYFTHKLGLAVDAQNHALQGYYLHEVDEVVEHLEGIQEADGIEVGNLVKAKLVPAFDALEGEVEAGDQGRIARAYENLIGACNACHKAVNRPYIHIERQVDNPYPQSFSPTP
jgi:hypothetical protein